MGLLFTRIRRLIEANLRELLAAARDPGIQLLEYTGELQQSYGVIKAELADASGTVARLERQLQENQQEAGQWRRKAALAVGQGDDDLAREALRRAQRTETLASHVAHELKDQVTLAESFAKTLADLRGRLEEAEQQRDRLLAGQDRAQSADKVTDVLKSPHWWRADSLGDRLAEDINQSRDRLAAYQELLRSGLEQEFRALDDKKDVEIELKSLKASISKDKGK
jgi:phage shock protein A